MELKQEKEIFKPLVDELLKLAALPKETTKKELWAGHQALKPAGKTPVSVYYEGIPSTQWELMLGKNCLKAASKLAQDIEFDLRKRLWMAKNVPDDHIVWPLIQVNAPVSKSFDWGVPLKWIGDDNPEHAKQIDPPFKEGFANEKIKFTDVLIDDKKTADLVTRAKELTDGKLTVSVQYKNMGYSPFDFAVEFRGLETLLYDVIDTPEKVHELMTLITDALLVHHKNREEKGWIKAPSMDNKYLAFGWRVHASYLREGYDKNNLKLADEWAYVSAQTASGLGPDMYAEFVHPYNEKLAALFTGKTVYYHGCEPLDQKASVIKTLSNLRRFHISPWSDVKSIREETKDAFVYEVHDHPGKVFFGMSKDDMKRSIKKLVDAAKGSIFDLNLSDIHNVNGNPNVLKEWAEAAQEVMQ